MNPRQPSSKGPGSATRRPWHEQVRNIVAWQGGDEALLSWYAALQRLLEQRPRALVVQSVEGDIDTTYQRLISSSA